MIAVGDLFSDVGFHALGLERAGPFKTSWFVERNPFRRACLAAHFPNVDIHDDVQTFTPPRRVSVTFGGPPCQETSVAAAIHGRRSGVSLWSEMLRVGLAAGTDWFVVEQPPGNKAWETQVAWDLRRAGFHVARLEFGACDVGAPYIRRRVYLLACACMSRLEIAWAAGPSAIERVKRSANARATWDPDQLAALRVDARSAGEMDASHSRGRKERIQALGDANPPEMAEVIGHVLMAGIMAEVAA